MKHKIIIIGMWAFVFVIAISARAASQNKQISAEDSKRTGGGNEIETRYQIQGQDREQVTSTTESEDDERDASTTEREDQDQEDREEINSEEHRSTVSDFVHGLFEVADREEGGIGQEVRTIAQEQDQSATTTIQAMEEVKTKSKIAVFLFGSDYKNLGTLRSEAAQTQNRLEQLDRLSENAKNEADKTQLQSQIQALTQEQTKIENFIQAQEGKFSLFGWLVKFFNQ